MLKNKYKIIFILCFILLFTFHKVDVFAGYDTDSSRDYETLMMDYHRIIYTSGEYRQKLYKWEKQQDDPAYDYKVDPNLYEPRQGEDYDYFLSLLYKNFAKSKVLTYVE